MNKKILLSATVAIGLTFLVVVGVLAGATRDFGTLETTPPPGKVNYTAWLTLVDFSTFLPIHPPQEIMTEDSFNAAQGPDGGYTANGWQIQVENMTGRSPGSRVNINFCELDKPSGRNWFYFFLWSITPSETDHGEVPLRTSTSFTPPKILSVDPVNGANLIRFIGTPNTTYQVYRSQNPATEGSDRSNGRYLLIGSALTNQDGYHEYTDDTFNPVFPTWYVIMYFAPEWNGEHGCHSEFTDPTSALVTSFNATYDSAASAVELTWDVDDFSNVAGYNLYRSTSPVRPDEPINAGMIPANIFAFTDTAVEFGETYYYWLEVVPLDGRESTIVSTSVRMVWRFYLPLLQY